MKKIAGSGSESGSISHKHGSADPDPDPHQNVMDLQHCFQDKIANIAKSVDAVKMENNNMSEFSLKFVSWKNIIRLKITNFSQFFYPSAFINCSVGDNAPSDPS